MCSFDTVLCLCTICYRYLKHTFLDEKSCSWKTICNHNKGSGWPEEMLTVAEFLTPISVYIKRVCAVPFIYKLTWSPSQEVYDLGLTLKDADCGMDRNGWKTQQKKRQWWPRSSCANPYPYCFTLDSSSSRYQTTLQHTYSQPPQEEPWGAGMVG